MAVSDLIADFCHIFFMSRFQRYFDYLTGRCIHSNYRSILFTDHIILKKSSCKHGIIQANPYFTVFVRNLSVNFLERFMPLNIHIFHRFSGQIKIL